MKQTLEEILAATRHSIIVSCQALPGEPLYYEEMSLMPYMAKAAQMAGCKCIRTSSVRDVEEIKKATGLPVIGLIKRTYEGYDAYITPTMKEIDELVAAESDIIALDCTLRTRGDGTTINEFLAQIREKYPDIVLMADVSTHEEGVNAWKCGVNLVGTTLSGYTPYSPKVDGPDFELVSRLVRDLEIPVIAEGKVHYPDQAKKMLELGVHAVVVGGAITRPLKSPSAFIKRLNSDSPERNMQRPTPERRTAMIYDKLENIGRYKGMNKHLIPPSIIFCTMTFLPSLRAGQNWTATMYILM